MTTANKDRLITMSEVMERTSLSRSYIYVLIKRGKMPAPIKLGAKCSRWSELAVDQWVTGQIG